MANVLLSGLLLFLAGAIARGVFDSAVAKKRPIIVNVAAGVDPIPVVRAAVAAVEAIEKNKLR